MTDLKPLSREERDALREKFTPASPTNQVYVGLERALHTIDLLEQERDGALTVIRELRSLNVRPGISLGYTFDLEQRQARLVEALKAKDIRLRDLFDRHERPTYHESSNPDSDLALLVADGSEILREIGERG